MIKHIVIFRLKPEATQAQRDDILAAANEMPKGMTFVKGFCAGLRVRPRSSHDMGLIVDLEDMEALSVWGPHLAHQAFVAKLRESGIVDLSSIASLDFEV